MKNRVKQRANRKLKAMEERVDKQNGNYIATKRELPARQLSSFYLGLFFPLGPLGLDSGRISQPLAK